MIDPRFHYCAGALSLKDLCETAGLVHLVEGDFDSIQVEGASDLEGAGPTAITFAAGRAYAGRLEQTAAGIVLITEELRESVPSGARAIVCDAPYDAFIAILNVLYPDDTRRVVANASHSTPDPKIEPGVQIGTHAVLGPASEVGEGTVIGPNAVIGAGVTIGRNCVIGANVTIECAHIGDHVVLQAGAVVGAEGYGFQIRKNGHVKIPQLGRVIIQNRVEIGANTSIDRGTLTDTVIGEGTKIDNLVQVGHNSRIGRNCIISGTCAISGSTVLEDGVVMGGGAGTAGHLTIGAGSTVYARSGVTRSFPAGSNIAGAPAQDVRMWKREIAAMRRLSKGDG